MDAAAFNQFLEDELDSLRHKLGVKGAEYVPGGGEVSRFHNFEVAAGLNDQSIEQALWGFVTKHIVSLSDMVKKDALDFSFDQWEEKIGDVVIYMLLLKGMVVHKYRVLERDEAVIKAVQEHLKDSPDGSLLGALGSIKHFPGHLFTVSDEHSVPMGKMMDMSLHTDPVNPNTAIPVDQEDLAAARVEVQAFNSVEDIFTRGDWEKAGDTQARKDAFSKELSQVSTEFMRPSARGDSNYATRKAQWEAISAGAWERFRERTKAIDTHTPKVEDGPSQEHQDWLKRVTPPPGAEHYR